VRRGCERNVITYSSLISACEKAGRWELALELFREMHTEGCRPNVVTCEPSLPAAAGGAACTGLPLHAWRHPPWQRCVRLLHRPHLPLSPLSPCLTCTAPTPPLPAVNSLIAACAQGAQWEKAQELFEQMQHRGCKPDSVTFVSGRVGGARRWRRARCSTGCLSLRSAC
jgi:pentatricopeptide repeat domain-containing protein 1